MPEVNQAINFFLKMVDLISRSVSRSLSVISVRHDPSIEAIENFSYRCPSPINSSQILTSDVYHILGSLGNT